MISDDVNDPYETNGRQWKKQELKYLKKIVVDKWVSEQHKQKTQMIKWDN